VWHQPEFVNVVIKPNSLVLIWFKHSKKKPYIVIPQAWSMKLLDSFQIKNSIIFNPTYLAEVIEEFFSSHGLKNVFVSIALADNLIWERCCWISQEQPTTDHLDHSARTLVWNYAHLMTDLEQKKHCFYLFGIAREVLFQYQLLALKVPFNCCTITSKNRSLLYVASLLNQPPTSHTGYDDVTMVTDHCMKFIDTYGSEKLFDASKSFYDFFQNEKEAVITSLGLFLLGSHHELR
jgi:hypothetical protein